MIPFNFSDNGDDCDDPYLDLDSGSLYFSGTTWWILIRFKPAVYIWTWMIQLNFGGDASDPNLDPDSGLH